VAELARLHDLHALLFGKTEQWVEVDEGLRAELRERLARLGYEGALDDAFAAWAGTENLEERVDGLDRIDVVVLEELRKR
jgi:aminopeptidase N